MSSGNANRDVQAAVTFHLTTLVSFRNNLVV